MIRVMTLAAAMLVGIVVFAGCGNTMAVKCTAANCSGCCAENDECLGAMKQSRQACGTMGGECRVCLPDQLCSAGRCVRDPDASVVFDDAGLGTPDSGTPDSGVACGQRSEPCCANMGCFIGLSCQRGTCDVVAMPDSGSCGAAGEACCANQMCTASGTVCTNGFCVMGGGNTDSGIPDAGSGTDAGTTLRPTGAACNLDSQCVDGTCLQLGFADGYCTKACTTSTNCFGGSQCGNNQSGVGPPKVCLTQCATANMSPGGCRNGYVCEANQGTSGVPVCFPACTSNTTCGTAPICDSRGFCCGVAGFVCCGGTTCESGNTCNGSGNCIAGGGTGGGGGGATGGGAGTGGGSATGGGTGTGGGSPTGGGQGNNRPHGSACTDFSQCSGNSCITGWPSGYCTNDCTSSCASGSSCSPYISTSGSYCLQNCAWNGGQSTCRTGYVCDRYMINGSDQATCVVACPTTSCPSSTSCQSGFCCGKPFFKCCAGNTCPGGGTCQANGYCQ